MPSTLPLSVTGPEAARRPAQPRSASHLLPLTLACLAGALLPVGGALALTAARPPAEPPGRPAGRAAALGPLAATDPAVNSPSPAPAARQPLQAGPGPAARQPSAAAAPTAPVSATTAAPAASAAAAGAAGVAPVISDVEFQQLLRGADLDRLNLLCLQLVDAGDDTRLRLLRERLLTIHLAPQPLAVVLANAEVMLSCRMPDGALSVLDRIGPARGAEQVQWLTLQWRAANAALDHRRAALALERLAAEDPARLESLQLPLQQRSDGSWSSRSALEMLASHLESAGLTSRAAALLLLSRNPDAPAAERLAQAARLLADLPAEQREPVFERALEQAAAVGSWGLVGDLLAAQASLPSSPEAAARTAERRLRLSRRLDDAYGEWRALQNAGDPNGNARRQALLLQLRSPQAPAGHAEGLPEPAPLPPLYSASQSRPRNSRPGATSVPAAGTDVAPAIRDQAPRPVAPPSTGSPVPSQP